MIFGCARFGYIGANPVLAIPQIILEVSNFGKVPIDDGGLNGIKSYSSDHYSHYLWAYILAPLAAGGVGGILSLIHMKCSEEKEQKEDE